MVSGIGGTSGGSCVSTERGGGGGSAGGFMGVVVFMSKSVVGVCRTPILWVVGQRHDLREKGEDEEDDEDDEDKENECGFPAVYM